MTVPYLGLGRAQEIQCTLTPVVPQGLHCCSVKNGPCQLCFHGHDWSAGLEITGECEGGRRIGAILRVDGS
jgi:hypothetical protein